MLIPFGLPAKGSLLLPVRQARMTRWFPAMSSRKHAKRQSFGSSEARNCTRTASSYKRKSVHCRYSCNGKRVAQWKSSGVVVKFKPWTMVHRRLKGSLNPAKLWNCATLPHPRQHPQHDITFYTRNKRT
ncbi:unnamed protein product [Ixodes persulcatus]